MAVPPLGFVAPFLTTATRRGGGTALNFYGLLDNLPDDRQLLHAISRGELTRNGIRNRDLQRLCFAHPAATPAEGRRRSAWANRKLRLLRAHGLIYKVTGTHRYQLTKTGRIATTAILTALRSTIRQLTAAAA